MTEFDAFMVHLPQLVLTIAVGAGVSWLVVRGAVLSALRKHSAEQRSTADD